MKFQVDLLNGFLAKAAIIVTALLVFLLV